MVVDTKRSDYKDIISKALSVGYHLSVGIMLTGIVLYLIGVKDLALTIISVGLFTLLATPLVRVFTAAVAFYFMEKDKKYAVISLAVFLILTASIFIGHK